MNSTGQRDIALRLALAAAIGLNTSACSRAESTSEKQQGLSESSQSQNAAVLPARSGQTPHPLAGVAAIIEADVSRTWEAFDERTGPRTFYELSNVVPVAGKTPKKLTFSQLGGLAPDGSRTVVSELNTYSVGSRYVFFLGRQASVYTAVWAGLAFRVEKMGKREVVFAPDGNVVLAFGVGGVKLGNRTFLKKNVEAKRSVQAAAEFDTATAETDSEVAKAPLVATFLEDAAAATVAAGGPLGEEIEMEPAINERWDEAQTTPAEENK